MAATISYAKIVRNQKDDEGSAPGDNINSARAPLNEDVDTENKTEPNDKDDPSFKEVNNGKKVCRKLGLVILGGSL